MFVTHHLDEAPRLTDRIAKTKDGSPPIEITPHQLKS